MITTAEQVKKLLQIGYPSPVPLKEIQPKDIQGNLMFPIRETDDFQVLISEALQWIRDNKGIECGVYPALAAHLENRRIAYEWIMFGNEKENITILRSKITKLYTHPLAESALLDAVLDYLIEKKDESNK